MSATFLFNNVSAEELGITAAVLRRVNLDEDTLELTFSRDVDVASSFPMDSDIVLMKDGVVIFRGKAKPAAFSGDAQSEGRTVVFANGWWHLTRLPFADETGESSGERTTNSLLYRGGESTLQMLETLVSYAAAREVPVRRDTLSLDAVTPTRTQTSDRTVADLVRMVMNWHYDSALRWNYSTNPPTIETVRRAALAATIKNFSVGTRPLAGVSLVSRQDLVPRRVIIRVERRGTATNTRGYRSASDTEVYPPGDSSLDELDVLTLTMLLDDEDSYEDGQAQRLYEMLAAFPWEGELHFQDEDCSTGLNVGDAICLAAGQSDWAAMNAFVQEIEEDLFAGKTRVGVGLPRHLGLITLAGLRRDVQGDKHRDDAAAEVPEALDASSVPSGQFQIYGRPGDDGFWHVYVTPGTVGTGEPGQDLVPKWNADALDEEPRPYVELSRGDELDLFLRVEWLPDVQYFALVDSEEVTFYEYRAIGTGDIEGDVTVEDAVEGAQAPIVNPETGAVTQNGVYFFKIGRISWLSGDVPVISQEMAGSFSLWHVPPNRLYKLPDPV